MPEDSLIYNHAQPADYRALLNLNEDAVPAVNSIDIAELRSLHEQSLELIVARTSNGSSGNESSAIAGFLLALPETCDYKSLNFQYFKAHFDSFAYVDRIIVAADMRGLGVGQRLYAELFARRPEIALLTCEVNVKPPNPVSLAFHTRIGFEPIAEQDTEGGRKRVALMVRRSENNLR